MNYVQVLENRISHMRQSFFKLISHVEQVEITRRQPGLTHVFQDIVRDFLSAAQITERLDESQLGDRHACRSRSGSDPNLSGPVGFPNIYTSCTTELAVPVTVPIIEPPMPAFVHPFGPSRTFFETKAPRPRNFAQRLYSSCIKRAYGLLTNPSADGTEVARVFRYSFHHSDVNTMVSTFDTLLQTNADYQTAYVYTLGGAGTHYRNRHAGSGIVQYVPLGQGTPSKCDDDTWFDPRDIEGWLEENGLVIGGMQSFIYLSESRSFEPYRDMTLCPQGERPPSSTWEIRQCAKILNVDRFLQGLSSPSLICFSSMMRRDAESLFGAELLSRGVCLGCAPGFRRLDVEAAFRLAISDDPTFIRELPCPL